MLSRALVVLLVVGVIVLLCKGVLVRSRGPKAGALVDLAFGAAMLSGQIEGLRFDVNQAILLSGHAGDRDVQMIVLKDLGERLSEHRAQPWWDSAFLVFAGALIAWRGRSAWRAYRSEAEIA